MRPYMKIALSCSRDKTKFKGTDRVTSSIVFMIVNLNHDDQNKQTNKNTKENHLHYILIHLDLENSVLTKLHNIPFISLIYANFDYIS